MSQRILKFQFIFDHSNQEGLNFVKFDSYRANAFVRAPEFDARSVVFTRIRIARRPAMFLDHVRETGVHVGVQVDH